MTYFCRLSLNTDDSWNCFPVMLRSTNKVAQATQNRYLAGDKRDKIPTHRSSSYSYLAATIVSVYYATARACSRRRRRIKSGAVAR